MDYLDVIRARKTTYDFTEKEVSDDFIEKILEAGRLSPSPHNCQPWKFIVVRDPKKIAELMDANVYGSFKANPTAMIVVVMEALVEEYTGIMKGEPADVTAMHKFASMGIAIANMANEATNLGISSCILSLVTKKANMTLQVPKDKEANIALCLGYESKTADKNRSKRKAMNELAFAENYTQEWKPQKSIKGI